MKCSCFHARALNLNYVHRFLISHFLSREEQQNIIIINDEIIMIKNYNKKSLTGFHITRSL